MVETWKQQNLTTLQVMQDKWVRKNQDKGFLEKHPIAPTKLSTKEVFRKVRLLRVCSNLSYLVVAASSVSSSKMRFVKVSIEEICMESASGRVKLDCPVAEVLTEVIGNSSRSRFAASAEDTQVTRLYISPTRGYLRKNSKPVRRGLRVPRKDVKSPSICHSFLCYHRKLYLLDTNSQNRSCAREEFVWEEDACH